ncbi:MAG: UbiA family prenyltransferase [Planctomycetota bacterium]
MLALGRLLRLSLAPSAIADVAAGLIFANHGRWPAGPGPFCLMASSACVYHGAMALNDWHDRGHDAATRPDRPIPSGAVAARTALALGATLLVIGPLLALVHSPGAALWSMALGLVALCYDLGGRGAWLGPLLLAGCRAGNLGLGLFFASGVFAASIPLQQALVAMVLYGVFVLRVSQLGRMEDGEDADLGGPKPKALVLSAALMLLLVPFLPPFGRLSGILVASAIAWPAAFSLVRLARLRAEWTRADVERAMGLCLRRFLIFSAALAARSWAPPTFDALIVAALILSGYLISARLRRVFPPS